jgi:hypothetical protein
VNADWIAKSPAAKLSKIKVKKDEETATQPFTPEEMEKIFGAIPKANLEPETAQRVRTLVLIQRHARSLDTGRHQSAAQAGHLAWCRLSNQNPTNQDRGGYQQRDSAVGRKRNPCDHERQSEVRSLVGSWKTPLGCEPFPATLPKSI